MNDLLAFLICILVLLMIISLIINGIKILKYKKHARDTIIYRNQFSSKETHTALLRFMICILVSLGVCYIFFELSIPNTASYIVCIISILIVIMNFIKILAHWKKEIDIDGTQLIYTDGFGRLCSFTSNQIININFSSNAFYPGGSSKICLILQTESRKKKINIYMYWEAYLLMQEWFVQYCKPDNRYKKKTVILSIDDEQQLFDMIKNGEKAKAVTYVRRVYGWGVSQATEYVDSILSAQNKIKKEKDKKSSTVNKKPNWSNRFLVGGIFGISCSFFGGIIGGRYSFGYRLGEEWGRFASIVFLIIGIMCLLISAVIYVSKLHQRNKMKMKENFKIINTKFLSTTCLVFGIGSFMFGIGYLPLGGLLALLITFLEDANIVTIPGDYTIIMTLIPFILMIFPMISFITMIITIVLAIHGMKYEEKQGKFIFGIILSVLGQGFSIGMILLQTVL